MLVTVKIYGKIIQRLSDLTRYVVDLETEGLRPFHGDKLCGIAIKGGGKSYYFPFRHKEGTNLPLEYLEDFKVLLSNPDVVYVGANYKFDMEFLYADGIDLPTKVEDAQLAAHLMNENEPTFKLKSLAAKYVDKKYLEEEDKLIELIIARKLTRSREKAKGMISYLRPEEVEPYACDDVNMTDDLASFYKPHLEEWGLNKIYEEVCDYLLITTRMELRGLKVCKKTIQEYIKESDAMVAPAQAKLDKLAGYPINGNSPKQLSAATGLKSTKIEVLEDILSSVHADKKLKKWAKAIMEFRGWSKVNGTYYRPYLDLVDGLIHEKNVIRGSLSLIGTISGRLSCYSPNLQAIPRYTNVYKVKDVFVARKGYLLVSADYSQAEMRLAAHYCRVIMDVKNVEVPYETSMDYILSNNLDMHGETAKNLGIPRDTAKRINLSIIYGIQAKTLSDRLHCDFTTAADYLKKYHAVYPGLKLLYNAAETLAYQNDYIVLWTGRLRRYNTPKAERRKASSNLIQGGIAEIMRKVILRLDKALSKYDIHMLLQVHDQILFEVPVDTHKKFIPEIVKIMEDFQFRVPLTVDVKVGKRWGRLQEWDKQNNCLKETA